MTTAQTPIESHRMVGRVSHIAIYPVKSCAGVELKSVSIGNRGLEGDREYMVVRAEPGADGVHEFVTQRDKRSREEPKPQTMAVMALIRPEVTGGSLTRLTWKGNDPIDISPTHDAGEIIRVRVHGDVVSAVDQSAQVAAWLSEHLDLKVRLVRASGSSFHRRAKQNFLQNTNEISFHDAYPIHWVMQESVDELSTLAGQEIPWTRFRPNIVGDGGEPRIEHEISEGRFGEVRFVQPKPCTRCPITTVDQEAGEKRGNEPLTTLQKYKRWNVTREVLFGENALPMQSGSIGVGDDIFMVSVRNPPLNYGL